MFQMILSDIPHQRLYITEDTGLSWKTVRPSFSPYRLILSPSNQSWVLGYNLLEMKVGKSCMSKAQLDFVFTEEQITAKIKNKCLPYKFYVLGQIGLSKQCRPRSDCFWRNFFIFRTVMAIVWGVPNFRIFTVSYIMILRIERLEEKRLLWAASSRSRLLIIQLFSVLAFEYIIVLNMTLRVRNSNDPCLSKERFD